MKIILSIIVFLFLYINVASQNLEIVSLSHDWKFQTGDNLEYASPGFDDSAWKEIGMNKIWEEQGYDPYDGFAWYRTKIFIPSSLKQNSFLKDSLKIYLGKINNFDQTFLNGEILGSNGKNAGKDFIIDTSFINAPTNYWDLKRRYTIAVDDPRINWDAENIIAVRVFDQGGQGGMYTGDQYLSMTSIIEYLELNNTENTFVFSKEKISKHISLKNISGVLTLNGELIIEVKNKLNNTVLTSLKEPISLKPSELITREISIPLIDQSCLISYIFDFNDTDETFYLTEETPYILTPAPPESPRINSAKVFGGRPGNPLLFKIAASGKEPLLYSAKNLPDGLSIDKSTGIITGTVKKEGTYKVELSVKNSAGEDNSELKIIIGDRIALTPPMGWNSWNCWGLSVDQQKVIAAGKSFLSKGLINYGWTFINIDDGWEIFGESTDPKRDNDGSILTNEKFPDMKSLGDSLHSFGLKFGIYSSPGPLTCGGYTASYQHEQKDADSYAYWGIDYLKYDWCSYDNIAKDKSLEELKKPYIVMRDALDNVNRDIVYSLCQYGMGSVWEWGDSVGGNLWRTTGDITDTWESMRDIGFSQIENAPYSKPGNWNDPDMLVVGWVGWGPNLHPSRLSPDEQYTHISLWCLLSAPLLIGCDLERLDEFTLNLLTNNEVLAVDQDPLGKQAKPLVKSNPIEIWVKELEDGSIAAGIFNLGNQTENYSLKLSDIGIDLKVKIRDIWRQKDLGYFEGSLETQIPSHGVVLIKVSK